MSPGSSSNSLVLFLADEQATLRLGARIAHTLRPGAKLYLSGELGAGKTTLVRGVLRALGMQGKVKSPTYALVELYKLSKLDLYHIDCFRFDNPAEWIDAGLSEVFTEAAVVIVEWPERAAEWLPAPDVAVTMTQKDRGKQVGRQLSITAGSELGQQIVETLRDAIEHD